MGELTESSNIAELISQLVDCWHVYNITHRSAIDASNDIPHRDLCGSIAESCVETRYNIVKEIDDYVERVLCAEV